MDWESILRSIWEMMPILETVIAGIMLSGFMSLLTWVWPAGNNKNLAAAYRGIAVVVGVGLTVALMKLHIMAPDMYDFAIKFLFIFLFSELFYRTIGIKYINRIFK